MWFSRAEFNYFQLILFLVLIGKFDQKSNLQYDWFSTLLELTIAQMGRKCDSQEPRVVLDSFYIKILLINLLSSPNREDWSKVKLFSPR